MLVFAAGSSMEELKQMAGKWMVELEADVWLKSKVEMNQIEPAELVELAKIGQFEDWTVAPPELTVVVTTPSECQPAETKQIFELDLTKNGHHNT